MKVFSIVVTFNGEKWVDRCFGSLVSSSVDDHTVLCIDNGSSDATLDLVREKFPNVLIFETGENLGFGKANNMGMKKALEEGADYVFLLNQDAWIRPDTIRKLIDGHISDESYGILSPVHLNGTGNDYDYLFKRYLLMDYKEFKDIPAESITNSHQGLVYPVRFVNAAMWLISRKALETIGGFNPYFFLYGEDREYLNRCDFHGFKTGIVINAAGFHDRVQQESENTRLKGRIRAFEVEMLDPHKSYSRLRFFLKIAVRLVKYTILLRPEEVRSVYSLWSHLLENEQEILRYRQITSRRDAAFIS